MAELMRLRIPKGWVILDNKLFDVEPITEESNDRIINWHEGFIQDVVWIQEYKINGSGEYEIPKINHYNIDITWLPDGNIHGQYYAKLSLCSIDGMDDVERFESRSRFEIRAKIESWMSDITDNYSQYHKLHDR